MAITSHFYDGPLTETTWAEHRMGAPAYGVEGPTDWKVSAVAGADRTISIAAGKGFGRGVADESDSEVTIQLDPISTGTRWDLIVAHRDWQPASGGPTYFAKINGTSAQAIPSGRQTTPGIEDDQPLALVQVTAGKTAPTAIIDLRCWASSGGIEAAHALSKTYLDEPGTSLKIGASVWRYELQANNLFAWKEYLGIQVDGVPAGRTPIIKTGNAEVATNASGDFYINFGDAFPGRLVSFSLNDSTDPRYWQPLIIKHLFIYSDRFRLGGRVYDFAGNVQKSKTGLYVAYTALGY